MRTIKHPKPLQKKSRSHEVSHLCGHLYQVTSGHSPEKNIRRIGPGVYAVGPLGEIQMTPEVIAHRKRRGLPTAPPLERKHDQ